ncbi:DUF4142 domain-containing protein [Chitinimonas koreensis]|uniref:DUF4142 domain-containing protein n=1 Tax=Chitinimonas koreensis TaxID=356302 RepID=UPI000428DAA8|nr:DUF4142 domain-containing protein [Chitinimonas koreensis]QNM95664.1 DUF4142 domain-containing protein [Chitinimonas koreensis]
MPTSALVRVFPALLALALAAAPLQAGGLRLQPNDEEFVLRAIERGEAEAEASRLARQRTQDPALRALARQIETASAERVRRLRQLARQEGMTLPRRALPRPQLASLRGLQDGDFDRAYLEAIALDSQRTELDRHLQQADSGVNPVLRRQARRAVPVLERQVAEAQRLAEQAAQRQARD